jgi:hypothetical protein
MKIWCLFSIDNNYDQPDNNLVCFWTEKPTLDILGQALNIGLLSAIDEEIISLVDIWRGNRARLHFDTEYRIQEVEEGERL